MFMSFVTSYSAFYHPVSSYHIPSLLPLTASLPLLPPGPCPPVSTTFLTPASVVSASFPCRGPELVASECIAHLYSASLAYTPSFIQILIPAFLSPAEVIPNSHPLTAVSFYPWFIARTCAGTPPGLGLCGGSSPTSPPQKSELPVSMPWRTPPIPWENLPPFLVF